LGIRSAVDLLAHATDEEPDNLTANHLCRVEECGGSGLSVEDLESV
jgi:hypothetical protein